MRPLPCPLVVGLVGLALGLSAASACVPFRAGSPAPPPLVVLARNAVSGAPLGDAALQLARWDRGQLAPVAHVRLLEDPAAAALALPAGVYRLSVHRVAYSGVEAWLRRCGARPDTVRAALAPACADCGRRVDSLPPGALACGQVAWGHPW